MELEIFEKMGKEKIFRGEYNNVVCVVKVNDIIYDEIEALKILKHSNIVSLLHHYEDGEKLYTLLEYFRGDNLYDWKRKNMTTDVSKIISQLCDIVQHIHSNGYIHGSLSATNIIVNNNKDIKIINFRSAKKINDKKQIYTSPAYLSPELVKGGDATIKSDLWALGILLFIVLTGDFPFNGNSEKTVHDRILNNKPKYKKYKISKLYKKQIKNLLKRNPEKRFL